MATIFQFTGQPFDSATGLQYNLHRWYNPHTGRWLSVDWIEDDLRNTYRYVENDPTNATDPYGLARRENIKIDKRWTFGVDRGQEVYGGFEIHVYDNGKEVAKLNGHGGWCDTHGGKELPYTPPEFRKKFPDIFKKLTTQIKNETKSAIVNGWRPRPAGGWRPVMGVIAALMMGAQAYGSLDSLAESGNYRNLMECLQEGNLSRADFWSQELKWEIMQSTGAAAGLDWEKAWEALKADAAKVESEQ